MTDSTQWVLDLAVADSEPDGDREILILAPRVELQGNQHSFPPIQGELLLIGSPASAHPPTRERGPRGALTIPGSPRSEVGTLVRGEPEPDELEVALTLFGDPGDLINVRFRWSEGPGSPWHDAEVSPAGSWQGTSEGSPLAFSWSLRSDLKGLPDTRRGRILLRAELESAGTTFPIALPGESRFATVPVVLSPFLDLDVDEIRDARDLCDGSDDDVDEDGDGVCVDEDCDDSDPSQGIGEEPPEYWGCSAPASVTPEEIGYCYDGFDNDCDGHVDEDDSWCQRVLETNGCWLDIAHTPPGRSGVLGLLLLLGGLARRRRGTG